MPVRYIKVIFLFICLSLSLTGCWDSRDIQERDIATAVMIDYKDGVYSFLIETANIRGSEKSSGGAETVNRFNTLKAQGDSYPDTRYDLDRKSDSPIFFGATRTIVFTERLARHGIEEYVNRVRGFLDYRKTIDIVITSSNLEDLLEDQPENDISPGFAIEHTLRSMSSNNMSVHVSVGDILQALAVKKVGFFLSQINNENGENTQTGFSVFKDGKMIGNVLSKDSRGIIYLNRHNARFIYNVTYKNNTIAIETTIKKLKIDPYYDQKKVRFKITAEFEGKILYMSRVESIDDELEKKYEEALKDIVHKELSDTIKKAQKEFGCDYLGFYKYFRVSYPQAFKTINWNEAFSQADVEMNIKTEIEAAGMYEINPKSGK